MLMDVYELQKKKKKNSVINYSLSFHSTPERPSFIFETQIKIFFDEIWEVYDSSIEGNIINTFKVQKGTKDIIKMVDVTTVVQP